MSSTFKPITYPAWTYKSLNNAYKIPLDATYTYFGNIPVVGTLTLTTAGVYYTAASVTLVPKNPHLEIVWASELTVNHTGEVLTVAFMINGSIVYTKTYNPVTSGNTTEDLVGTYLTVTTGQTITISVAYASSVGGVSLSWYVQGGSGLSAFYAGTIVLGSGYNENGSGLYLFPTLSGAQVKYFKLMILGTNGNQDGNAAEYWGGGTIKVVSANSLITYLTQNISAFNITGTVVDVESMCEYGDSSTPLGIMKVGNYPAGPVLVLELQIEEGDVLLQNYPWENIEGI